MKFELKTLSLNDGKDIYDMLQQIPYSENGFINNVNGKSFEEYKSWLSGCYEDAKQEKIIDGWKVPQTTFWFFVDDKPIGFGKIRHFLTEKLRYEGGTIGYSICPAERGKGYGKEFLAALLKECKRLKIDKVLLTIKEYNIPSIKTALANRGIVEKSENDRLYIWIEVV